MTRLLVTGASGLLGLNLALIAKDQGYDVLGWTHNRQLHGVPFETQARDLNQLEQISSWVEQAHPEIIVHCAAMADIDEAERNPERADRINTKAPEALARAAKEMGIQMIHISSDAIFDGKKGNYVETDAPNPLNAYARSKLAAEEAIAKVNPGAVIARVVFYGWSMHGNRSLAEFFFNNLSAGRSVNGFTDMFFTPLYAAQLSETLLEMAETNLNGIYHVFGPQILSKYEFGVKLAREFGLEADLIKAVSALSSGLPATRSLNLSMNTDKLRTALGHDLPNVNEGLRALHLDFKRGLREQLSSFKA